VRSLTSVCGVQVCALMFHVQATRQGLFCPGGVVFIWPEMTTSESETPNGYHHCHCGWLNGGFPPARGGGLFVQVMPPSLDCTIRALAPPRAQIEVELAATAKIPLPSSTEPDACHDMPLRLTATPQAVPATRFEFES